MNLRDQAIGFCQKGNLAFQQGRIAEALACFDAALAIRPDYVEALINRGAALKDLNRHAEAVASYDRALSLAPGEARALNNRGLALSEMGRFAEALASIDAALAAKPDYAGAHNNRGNALRGLKRLDDALASFAQAIACDPHFAAAIYNRAVTLCDLKRRTEALADFALVLAINPRDAEALFQRGTVLLGLQRLAEALASFDAALGIDPAQAEAWNNRGGTLQALKRYDEALASYDRALHLKPDYAEAWYHRGTVQQDLKRFGEALADYDKALALKPALAAALRSRGTLQWFTYHRFEAALADLEKAFALEPGHAYAAGDLLHLRMYGADWRDFARQKELLDAGVRAGKLVATPFVYQALSDSPADLQACARLYAADRFPPAPPLRTGGNHTKLRVGYVSGEFRQQATAFLTAGLYEAHDRNRFEIFAFDNGWDDNSTVRRRLEGAFDSFIAIANLSDQDAAEKIAAQEIDILVNLNGYFGDTRMGVFARRPAPIQVNYLGFPGTLGADYIDYILADRIVIPESEQARYTEKVVYLPGCYQVNDSKRRIAQTVPTRSACGLPDSGFVFCNFNQGYKLTPAMFAAWMRILKQAEGSVLWLLQSNPCFAENLRRAAEEHGIAAQRLVFAPPVAMEDHLARHRLADLSLDTLPCGSHTTASDALWTGLPLLTCRGNAFPGRVAASLLQAIGLPELITDNLEQYEALAVRLARDPALLQSLRQKLAQNRLTAPLFDTAGFVPHIEAAYARMWDIHTRGESPRGFGD